MKKVFAGILIGVILVISSYYIYSNIKTYTLNNNINVRVMKIILPSLSDT